MEDCDFNINIAVIGMGLIGGSYAMALRDLDPKCIIGIDKDKYTLKSALDDGIIDGAYESGGDFLKEIDLIIVALYPKDTIEFIKSNLQYLKKGTLITDTSGIKQDIVDNINSFLPEYLEFIPGHPMAGKESRGIKGASKDIFKGANYIITPGGKNTSRGLQKIDKMARAIGCSNVTYISPKEHDRIITFTSQLPHIIAVSLMNLHEEDYKGNIELFTGGSFKDATRVAQINSKLWTELFIMNSDNLIEEIENFQSSMEILKKAIMSKDISTMRCIFEKSMLKRKELVKGQ
ncbi:prephenate dehydrogenase [Clostridium kluyveri]|uniref:Prephenate dehydrogenase n=1 Tax=Clostridium kluyveri TaxID=1534 RepID=A0A1L5F568_CLOKL|nr:prephenate dehydrogenase [Clostridium kluyveri]APM38166.1 prephenate dehydrogenase [Clostridium kluyveri]UZQ51823.1 prephenate dehydrogenase [Clostridium kluyveri]